jgi:hypothetical protein
MENKLNISERGKNLVTIVGLSIIGLLFIGGFVCLALDAGGSKLNQLEAAYKNARELHDLSVTQEQMAAKNECSTLTTLAAAKLLALNSGELKEGNREDLAKKASVECFTKAQN